MVVGLIINPPTPSARFEKWSNAKLPENLRNLSYHFRGGGVADHSDFYYFKTTPTAVDRPNFGGSLRFWIIPSTHHRRDRRFNHLGIRGHSGIPTESRSNKPARVKDRAVVQSPIQAA
ncbi:MAG: hypothetical protein OSA93_12840 [Akkermansiaceae bacterium]|nr:hypothetical protein [Akkermansiaceae bacterium]